LIQIVKLGGSIITDKSSYKTARPDAITRLAKEIASCVDRVVVVHGAGSYGHVLAKEHRMKEGHAPASAVAQVHADVRELQQHVLAALRAAGLAPLALSALDLARLANGELASFAYEPVHEALARGMTPVLGGDVVMDAGRGFGILSGDVIMVELARAMHPSRAIFATDVDGIYDRDPNEKGAAARLLPRIDVRTDIRTTESRVPDITGGMGGKLARARDVARTGVPVHIVNGAVAGRLADALAGKATIGTFVTA